MARSAFNVERLSLRAGPRAYGPLVETRLLELLRSLTSDESEQTVAPAWKMKDVAAHTARELTERWNHQ